MPNKQIVFDLETIAYESVLELLPPCEPDSRLKDPAKIEANIAKKEADRRAKLGLNPVSARICCFGWVDGETGKSYSHLLAPEASKEDERELLKTAWNVLAEYDEFITFNGIGFDIPVLLMRSAICRVRPSVKISTRRYMIENHYDLRAILGQWDSRAAGTLDFYCRLMGVRGKTEGMSGDQVQGYWDMGLRDEIGKYCEEDCLATWELYKVVKGFYLL